MSPQFFSCAKTSPGTQQIENQQNDVCLTSYIVKKQNITAPASPAPPTSQCNSDTAGGSYEYTLSKNNHKGANQSRFTASNFQFRNLHCAPVPLEGCGRQRLPRLRPQPQGAASVNVRRNSPWQALACSRIRSAGLWYQITVVLVVRSFHLTKFPFHLRGKPARKMFLDIGLGGISLRVRLQIPALIANYLDKPGLDEEVAQRLGDRWQDPGGSAALMSVALVKMASRLSLSGFTFSFVNLNISWPGPSSKFKKATAGAQG